MMGKRILWSPPVAEGLPSDAQFGIYPGSIVLYDAPTQEELAQAEPVLAAVEQCVGEMRALTEEMAAAEELTKDTIQVWLDKLLEKVAAAEGLSGADVAFPPMKSIWFADSYTNGARLRQMILDQSRQTDAFVNTLQATGEEWVQFRNGLTNSWFESISRMEGQIAEARGLLEGAKAVEAAEE